MFKRCFLLGFLGLLACGERHGGVAARVDGRTLSVDRLAQLMVLAQPLPLTHDVAYELASHWVNLAAFSKRMAAGDSLLDSATVLDVMGYRVRHEILQLWAQRLMAGMGPAEAARFDSAYAQELLQVRDARLHVGAPAVVRRLATDPWRTAHPPETLATFAGGAVTAGDLARHVQYLSRETHREIREAPEARIAQFVWGLTLQELLWLQADSAGVRLSDAAFRAIANEYRDAAQALRSRTGLVPESLALAGPTLADRERAAARRIEEYLEAAAARRVPLEAMPPFLAVPLLRAVDWEIVEERMDAVVQRARRLLAATEDSGPPAEPSEP